MTKLTDVPYHPTETRTTKDGIVVQRVQMAGIPFVEFRYDAWEPSTIMGPHATITHIDGKCYGKLATRRFESDLTVGEERTEKCRGHYDNMAGLAHLAIREAFPEAKSGHIDGMGGIYLRP